MCVCRRNNKAAQKKHLESHNTAEVALHVAFHEELDQELGQNHTGVGKNVMHKVKF